MIDRHLHDLLDDLCAHPPPSDQGPTDDIRRGRRLLRRRQTLLTSAGTAAAVTAVIVAGLLPGRLLAESDSGPTPATTSGDEGVVQQCHDVDSGALDPEVFGTGSTVVVSDASSRGVAAVIQSPDQSHWAACVLDRDPDTKFNGYAITHGLSDPGQSVVRNTMRMSRSSLSYIQRVGADTAEVEVDIPDGPTLSSEAVDGFVAVHRDGTYADRDTGQRSETTAPRVTQRASDGRELVTWTQQWTTCTFDTREGPVPRREAGWCSGTQEQRGTTKPDGGITAPVEDLLGPGKDIGDICVELPGGVNLRPDTRNVCNEWDPTTDDPNVISPYPPQELIHECRQDFDADILCGLWLALDDGNLPPGRYTDAELQRAVRDAGYELKAW